MITIIQKTRTTMDAKYTRVENFAT